MEDIDPPLWIRLLWKGADEIKIRLGRDQIRLVGSMSDQLRSVEGWSDTEFDVVVAYIMSIGRETPQTHDDHASEQ